VTPAPRAAAPRAVVAGALLLAGCASVGPPPAELVARAELRDAGGRTVGVATFNQVGAAVRVVLEAQGLPPGLKAVHVHQVGRCDAPGFTSAGDHFNPTGREHGHLNPAGAHAGDLANITVAADGRGRLESATERFTLTAGPTSIFDADGSALVVHGAPDDFRTDPTGNSGARIACGVIVRP
jgi:Cu-Zn family superoxide dismutase